MIRVYVAAPFELYPVIMDTHERLRRAGCTVTSSWVDEAGPGGDPLHLPQEELRRRRDANSDAIDSSDAMIVYAARARGGEMFVEFARAMFGAGAVHSIYWLGKRRILSVAALARPLQEDSPAHPVDVGMVGPLVWTADDITKVIAHITKT